MYGSVCVYLKGRWIWVLDFQIQQDGLFKGLGGKGEVHTIQSSFSSDNNTSSDLLKATQVVFGTLWEVKHEDCGNTDIGIYQN